MGIDDAVADLELDLGQRLGLELVRLEMLFC
jgi:hypothetical protein